MDRNQFDTLARLIWTTTSRRTALRTILGAALLGSGVDPVVAKGKGKNKRQRKRKKQKHGPCYPNGSCLPGPGQDNAGCDFSESVAFFEGNFQGSNLSGANLTGAQLANANLQGVDLGGACLVGANLLEADLAGVNLDGAIFCRTLMPDGTQNDSGCGRGTRCCPTPGPICRTCAGGNCIATIGQICSVFGTPCCTSLGLSCTASATVFITTCETPCDGDQECKSKFGPDAVCAFAPGSCPFYPGARCCKATPT